MEETGSLWVVVVNSGSLLVVEEELGKFGRIGKFWKFTGRKGEKWKILEIRRF